MSEVVVSDSHRLDCVVIDTNLWRSEFLLKTPLGASLLYIIRRRKGVLGLPEVVEREIEKHIVKIGLEAGEAITKNLRTIEILVGSRPDCPVPVADKLEQALKERMNEIESLVVRVPLTLEHARAALNMINAELPPNGPKNQQFKDSAMWRAVLDLACRYNVHFITNDRAFLSEQKNPSSGLAANLYDECKNVEGSVSVYVDLGSCLEKLRTSVPPLDQPQLARVIDAVINTKVRESAARRGFSLGNIIAPSVQYFITEKPDILALDYEIMYQLEESAQVDTNVRYDANLIAKGSCFYDEPRNTVTDVIMGSEQFEWREGDDVKQTKNAYGYANITLGGGRQDIFYRLRQPVKN